MWFGKGWLFTAAPETVTGTALLLQELICGNNFYVRIVFMVDFASLGSEN
jgi:hypothetical protein